MARYVSSGFENNAYDSNVTITGSGVFSIVSASPIYGTYSLRANATNTTLAQFKIQALSGITDIVGKLYYRMSIKIASYPTSAIGLFTAYDHTDTFLGKLVLNESGVIFGLAADDTTQIGNTPNPLTLNKVYVLDYLVDSSNLNSIHYSAWLSGSQFITDSVFDTTGMGIAGQNYCYIVDFHVGTSTFDLMIDDIVVDSTLVNAMVFSGTLRLTG